MGGFFVLTKSQQFCFIVVKSDLYAVYRKK